MKRIVLKAVLGVVLGMGSVGVATAQDSPYYGELRVVAFNFCPSGWLLAAGQSLSQNQYQPLFSLIGTMYGSGTGAGQFQLPNMTGRAPVGVANGSNSSNSFAQNLATAYPPLVGGVPTTSNVPGTVSGPITGIVTGTAVGYLNTMATGIGMVTLTAQNLPAHTHPLLASSAGISSNSPSGALLSTFPAATKLYASTTAPADTPMSANAIGPNTTAAPTPISITTSVPVSGMVTSSSSSSQPLTVNASGAQLAVSVNVPAAAPSLALNWCICTDSGYCLYPQRP